MNRIQYARRLRLAGISLVLAIAIPAILQPSGYQSEKSEANVPPLLAVFYPDYLYTMGVTGVSGTDNAHFSNPRAAAVNATGHLYVVDWINQRIQVFNKESIYQYTIGGFSGPNAVAINGSGHVYVMDTGNSCVQVFNNAGVHCYNIGSMGFSNPTGVAVNATGHVYVADKFNHRVMVFDKAGIYQYTLGTGFGSGPNKFNNPHAVAINATGYVFVVEQSNHRVQVFDNAGIYQYIICGNGAGSGINQFSNPSGIAINSSGYAYIVDRDNNRVQVFDSSGAYQHTICGNGQGSGNNQLSLPYGIATNSTGQVFVVDTNNHRVQVFIYIVAPTDLTIIINGGAVETGNTSVTLTLTATGATQMCFSNNGSTYTSWEAFTASKVWTLTGGTGLKTVYFKARNGTIEAAAPASDNITYLLPPSGLSVFINDGATMTASRSVLLVVWASGAEEMCFSNDNATWSAWESFTATKAWGLGEGAGNKTVYFKARNSTIETLTLANITYTIQPTGLSISINSGTENTTVRTVTLTLTATGATQMCFSNDGATWSAWESFKTTKTWDLPSFAGYKTVYFKVRNGTIESAAPVAASITYAPPSPPQDEVPAWAWVLVIAVIVEGAGLLAVMWILSRKGGTRIVPTEIGGEKKMRLGLLRGKISLLKGKLHRQDATGAATGEKKPEEKVGEVTLKPAPTPAPVKRADTPKPAPTPAPAKAVEAPKPAPTPAIVKQADVMKPAPAPAPAKAVEAPKPVPTPAPVKRADAPKPAPAPAPAKAVEAPKPASTPTKKITKKTSKKVAKKPA